MFLMVWKRGLLFAFCFLLLISFGSSHIGISPGVYSVDFEPNKEYVFTFGLSGEEGAEFDVDLGGHLEKYGRINKNKYKAGEQVLVYLKLPEEPIKPGINSLEVIFTQQDPAGGLVGIKGRIIANIKVDAPYPGQYVELRLSKTGDANVGEDIQLNLELDSKGTDPVTVYPEIEIYDSAKNVIERFSLESVYLEPSEIKMINYNFTTSSFEPGSYNASATISFGEGYEVNKEIEFRVGTLLIEVVNYTKYFERDKINGMDIWIQSRWNGRIEGVYANVTLPDYDISFITPTTDVNSFEKTRVKGFFDTTLISEEKFQALITLHYVGQTSEKLVMLGFPLEINWILIYIIAGSLVLLLLVLLVLVYVKKKLDSVKSVKSKR